MSLDINPLRIIRASDARLDQTRQSDTGSMPQTSVKSGRQEAGVLVETKALLAESGPPVDNDRVREIRKAVSDGTYPLSPTRVADAMIAAKFMLSDRK